MMRKAAIATAAVLLLAAGAFAGERMAVHPADTGQALVNPQMGWKLNFYSNMLVNYGSKLEFSDTLDDISRPVHNLFAPALGLYRAAGGHV